MIVLLALYVGGGLLLTALSVPLIQRRIPPNGLYGFRVRKTMEDPVIWYDVNEYAGKRLLATGLGTVLGAIALSLVPGISLDAYALACVAVVFGLLAICLLQSFGYLGTLAGKR